jgi:hypothetical protein
VETLISIVFLGCHEEKIMKVSRLAIALGLGLFIFSAGAQSVPETVSTKTTTRATTLAPRGKFRLLKRSLELGRSGHSVTLLMDGRILISGGGWGDWGGEPKAEMVDPKNEKVRTLESTLSAPISNATTLTLRDGRILMMGGDTDFETGLQTTEFFRPDNETFTRGPDMWVGRTGHSATQLADGRILIVGGEQLDAPVDSMEVFDPDTQSFHLLKLRLSTARAHHTATLFDENKILIVGGQSNDGILDTLEWIDLEKMEVVPLTPTMSLPRTHHTVTRLSPDELLIAGGLVNYGESSREMEIFNRKSQSLIPAGHMQMPRSLHTATSLHSGEILFTGGVANGLPLASTERCGRKATGVLECRPDANMSIPRWMHVSSLLPDGRILVVGGLTNKRESRQKSAGPSHSAEIFTP